MAQDPAIAEISALLNESMESPKETEVVEEEVIEEVVEDETANEIEDTEEPVEADDVEVEESELMIEDISTLKNLSEATGMEMSEIYDMEIGMGDNQAPIKLGKMKDEYQESMRMASQLAGMLEQSQNQSQQFQQVSDEVQNAQQTLYNIQKEFNDIDWPRYEAEQPGEAALSRQKFMEKGQQAQMQVQQAEQYTQQLDHQSLQHSAAKLMELLPAWKDEAVRKADQSEIRTALLTAGYTQQMLSNAQDPIAISLMHELIQLRKQASGASASVEKVRKAPRVLRRQNGQFASNKDKATIKLVAKAKQSPNKHTELAAAKALLGIKS